jgi:2-oxo-4-hydroxy-4-carboxy--5-ureidoimidazoline (OHCU) decarboxylase
VLELQGQLERLFEKAGPLLERLRASGPYTSGHQIIARAKQLVSEMSETEQIAVINAHPRIGENPRKISASSYREQGYDGDTTPPDVLLKLAALNEEYEQKFGFRFVIFVDRRSQQAIVPILEARLRGNRDAELRTALSEMLAIAADRLKQEA